VRWWHTAQEPTDTRRRRSTVRRSRALHGTDAEGLSAVLNAMDDCAPAAAQGRAWTSSTVVLAPDECRAGCTSQEHRASARTDRRNVTSNIRCDDVFCSKSIRAACGPGRAWARQRTGMNKNTTNGPEPSQRLAVEDTNVHERPRNARSPMSASGMRARPRNVHFSSSKYDACDACSRCVTNPSMRLMHDGAHEIRNPRLVVTIDKGLPDVRVARKTWLLLSAA
jgi:hypothetical protein